MYLRELIQPGLTFLFRYVDSHVLLCMMDSCILTSSMQAQRTNCSLQWPEKFIVMVMQQGQNMEQFFESVEQTVMGMENEYTLEKLDLKQKYQVSIKLRKNISMSIAEIANFCE